MSDNIPRPESCSEPQYIVRVADANGDIRNTLPVRRSNLGKVREIAKSQGLIIESETLLIVKTGLHE